MKIVRDTISVEELKQMSARFGNLVKGVVDVERAILAVDGELHSDLEALLLEDGSKQENIWGINLYPHLPENEFVEFDSIINIRPSQGNMSRGVENEEIRQRIVEIVQARVKR